MKPNLPPMVLLPILLFVAGVAALAVAWPGWTFLTVASIGVVTLGGGVAVYAASRRKWSAGDASGLLMKGSDRFLLTWVAATAVLWAFCAPDVYFRDAGELTGAAVNLGVPHPTGFPILCMLGKLASLMPAGNVFFRMNLLSGLAAGGVAAFAGLFVDRVVRRSVSDPGAAWWVGPLVYLGSAAAWLHGVTPEIYSPAALGLVASLFMALEGVERRDARWLMAASALCGIGLGGHITWPLYGAPAVILAVVAFAIAAPRGLRLRALFRVGFLCLFAAVAGALVVFYLPAAASRQPLMNWGDPSNVNGLIAHLTGQRIRDSFGDRMVSMNPAVLAVNASLAWRSVVESMGPVLPFAAAGVVSAFARGSKWATAAICLALADFIFAVVINPMGIRDQQVLLVATWALSILAGVGVAEAVRHAARRGGRAGAIGMAALAFLLVVFQWAASPADRDMRRVYGPRVVSDRILDSAPFGSAVLTASDDLSAILMARTAAEDARPDMVFLVKQHLSDTRYAARRLNPFGLENPGVIRGLAIDAIRKNPFESHDESPAEAVERAVKLLSTLGPVLFEPGESVADANVSDRLVAGFPLWTVAEGPVSASPSPDAWRAAMSSRHIVDRWGRAYLAEWVRLYGTRQAVDGRDAAAMIVLRSALALDPDDFRAAHNLGVLLADAGRIDEALDQLSFAVSIDPGYVRGWETLARTASRAGRSSLATDAAARAARLSGMDP